jgi:hypothetical protein
MTNNHPENHPNGYTSRELAFADARLEIAKLCALDRSPAYKAAVMEAIGAIEALIPQPTKLEIAVAAVSDEDLWAAAVSEVGTSKAPPYGFPVIVLPRPRDVAAIFRALSRRVGVPSACSASPAPEFVEATPHC